MAIKIGDVIKANEISGLVSISSQSPSDTSNLWLDSTSGELKYYNNGQWELITGGSQYAPSGSKLFTSDETFNPVDYKMKTGQLIHVVCIAGGQGGWGGDNMYLDTVPGKGGAAGAIETKDIILTSTNPISVTVGVAGGGGGGSSDRTDAAGGGGGAQGCVYINW